MDATEAAIGRMIDQIRSARLRRAPLDIRGGGTKSFYGEQPRGAVLPVKEIAGIYSYEPSELVITVRAGTLLEDVEKALAERRQGLAFEPPRFAPGGTVGGMIAAGLSGPSRASAGSVRDHVLGVSLVNGRGQYLRFGGQVMKNVAGYDVSRLMVGSWGILGVICEVSIKVLPVPGACSTLRFEWEQGRALEQCARWRGLPLPLQSTAWHNGNLYVRLAGTSAAVVAAGSVLGGEALAPDDALVWWRAVRDHTHPFFAFDAAELARGECLWRMSAPLSCGVVKLPGLQFIEWGGALRWCRTSAPPAEVRAVSTAAGGRAALIQAADKSAGAFSSVSEPLMRIHRAVKIAFDPDGILNKGRLYPDL